VPPSDEPTTAFVEFQRNLEFARRLVSGGRRLEQLQVQAFDIGDMFRAAWVQAVAALDHWVYEEIVTRAVVLAQQPGVDRPAKFNQLTIPMELFEQVHHHDQPLGEALRQHLENTFAFVTFQNPDKIQEGFAHVHRGKLWPDVAKVLTEQRTDGQTITADTIRQRVRAISRRRNQIAHEADRDPESPTGKRDIKAEDANQTIDWLELTAAAILVVLNHNTNAR
jgi:hypothetical protein